MRRARGRPNDGYKTPHYVAVDNQFKGQRIGKRLIEDAIARAHAAGMLRWTN
jgi:GNAT superfamily N-acetyltransferase